MPAPGIPSVEAPSPRAAASLPMELTLADPVKMEVHPRAVGGAPSAEAGVVADAVKCDPGVVDVQILVSAVLRRARSCKSRGEDAVGPVGKGVFTLLFDVGKDGTVLVRDIEGGEGLHQSLLACSMTGDFSFNLGSSTSPNREVRVQVQVAP